MLGVKKYNDKLLYGRLNWMSKGSVIGGIYNKPTSTANFTHFLIGALALIKGLMNNPHLPSYILVLAGVYLIFAVLFGIMMSHSPKSDNMKL